jgi:hydrogenase maturation protease
MGDDALGPFVIEGLITGYEFPPNVSVIDAGTPGLDLAPFLMGADAVIVIDSVKSDGRPGELRLYRRDAICAHAPGPRLGPHDPGFTQTLLTLDLAGRGPADVLLVGIVPETTAPRARISTAVRDAVPVAMRAVLDELARLNASPTPRVPAAPLAPWWERAA